MESRRLPGNLSRQGNRAARLHGIGKHRKAVLLLSHMDVVPVDPRIGKSRRSRVR